MVDTEQLIERLRGLDLKALSPNELYDLIQEVRGMLDKDSNGYGLDLDQRVRLLRVWHMLILIGDEVGLPARPEANFVLPEPELLAGPEPFEVPEPSAEVEKADEVAAPKEDLPEVTAPSVAFPMAEPDLVLVEPADHSTFSFEDHAKSAPAEIPLEIYGPFRPPEAVQQIRRIRMQMVKEGVLMNRVLPAGTIVLVYPLDADHLIEQGIAEKLGSEDETVVDSAALEEY